MTILFSSLKSWMNLTAVRKPYIKRSGTGAKVLGDPINMDCYAEGKVQVVTNKEGKEEIGRASCRERV